MIDAIAPGVHERILEIGPGRGALTLPLAARAGKILAVERDPVLARELRDLVPETVQVIEGDILGRDLTEWGRLLDEAAPPGTPLRVVGNLPYSVATPILARVLRSARAARFHDAVLMLQREVADRVVAAPRMRDYGPLAVLTSLHATAQCVLQLPPGAFRPAPRVRSTVVTLTFRDPTPRPPDPVRFDALVRQLFTQRRKQLVNALAASSQSGHHDPATICRVAGLDPARRPGTLCLAELLDLDTVLAGMRG